MNAKFLNSREIKELTIELEELYGINNLNNYQLIETGKRKIRAFSGSLLKEEMLKLAQSIRIEIIGMYMISKKDDQARINFDALQILKNQITKNIIEINKEQLEKWIRGYDLEIRAQRGTIVLKFEEDLVGVGKSNGERIFNYTPKERKIKTQLPRI